MKRKPPGSVYLAGAGPGDPGLLTVRARELLASADVVIHDWLVSEGVLRLAPQAHKIDMGKHPLLRGRKRGALQDAINRELVRQARSGKRVVRLKGGDPLVFGRGSEEALFLRKHRIPFEFVPGVSAGYSVPEYAGIPVTDRRFASQVTFVTGHEDPSKPETSVDWKKLAALPGTLVSFMGVNSLPRITRLLTGYGMSPKTPVSVIEWGTLASQRTVQGPLSAIAGRVRRMKIQSPSLVVIGHVNQLRKKLAWFEKRPLFGKTVVVTRAGDQAGRLRVLLEERGARAVEFPAIKILPPADWKPLDRELPRLGSYDWIVFTSVNGVNHVFQRIAEKKLDARIFSGARIAVIGSATAQALAAQGLRADLMPHAFHSAELLEQFRRLRPKGKKILLLRTDIAPELLRSGLEKEGAAVSEVSVYRTRPDASAAAKLRSWLKSHCPDFITFTSASTVHAFFGAVKGVPLASSSKFVSIGPMTSEALRTRGKKIFREARVHTLAGLADCLAKPEPKAPKRIRKA